MYKLLTCAALAASVSAQQAGAQDYFGVPRIETVVVVASRLEVPLREVASSVAVLDQEDIQARGHPSLADVLRTMPGVSVTNSGGLGKLTSLRVRGEDGYRTMVRVDGVDISDPTNTQIGPQVQHLMSANVARVELLRGPQGMMYGADAGGVLNVSTPRAESGWQGGLAAEGGRYNTETYSAHGGVSGDLGDGYWSVARVRTGGFNARADDPTQDDDGYKNTTWHGRQGVNITPTLRIEGVLRDTRAMSEHDRCGPSDNKVDDCIGHFRQRNQRLALTQQNAGGQNTFAYSKTRVNRLNRDAGEISLDVAGTIARFELNGHFTPVEQTRFVYGLEYRQDEFLDHRLRRQHQQDAETSPQEDVGNNHRWQMGGYFEYQQSVAERWFFTAGIRADDNEDFGSNASYRISAAQVLANLGGGALKLKSSLSTGFRAPSLSEIQYNRSQDSDEPLPELAQENSWGGEIGLEYFGPGNLHLEAVVFEQHITDEIYFDLNDWVYRQGDRSSYSRGLELIGSTMLANAVQLNANYTLVNARADSGAPRARQPRHMANLGIHLWPQGRFSVTAQVRAAHRTEGGGDRLDDYRVVDASARYRPNQHIHLYLRAENLLDADYQEVKPFNTSGAAAYAGITMQF